MKKLTAQQEELMEAIADGDLKKVKSLLAQGCDLDFQDESVRGGETPLTTATEFSTAMIQALIKAGADVNMPNQEKDTPLTAAVSNSNLPAIRALIKAGADVDKQGRDKRTPLTTAVKNGSLDIVKILVKAGADINLKDGNRKTPIECAEETPAYSYNYEDEISRYLQSAKRRQDKLAAGLARSAFFSAADAQNDAAAPPAHKKSMRAGAGAGAAAPERPVVFREDTLKEIFNAANWIGRTEEMIRQWKQVPVRLQKKLDFAANLAQAKRDTLKQRYPNKPALQETNAPVAGAETTADPSPAAPKPKRRKSKRQRTPGQ